jgi:RND family efflux transporter MFP subunit
MEIEIATTELHEAITFQVFDDIVRDDSSSPLEFTANSAVQRKPGSPLEFTAKGAAERKPRAAPWVPDPTNPKALKGRPNHLPVSSRLMESRHASTDWNLLPVLAAWTVLLTHLCQSVSSVVKILPVLAAMASLLTGAGCRKTNPDSAAAAGPVVVAVAKVTREDLFNEAPIPAEFRPYVEVELHAKVSGYLDKMNVDFGDKVKAGQLLATIEVPELHDQLRAALARQQAAEADYTNAHLAYTRLVEVNKSRPELVVQQDLDTAQSKDGAAAAALAAAQADAGRYQTLVKYTQITAPFDGVITRRYADPGALIQAGTASDTQALPLVRVSDNYRLRLDIPVSVKYVKDIHLGDSVVLTVDSLGGKSFTGKITRYANKVNDDTRTMTTEMEVANPNLEIIPGMYAAVVLRVEQRSQALAIPTEAVSAGKDPTVYVINASQEIEERSVVLGLETPDKYEAVSGVKEGDLVMIGNRSAVRPGQKVEAKLVSQPSVK